jgi:imidazole glycerol-phosphate synthase subunit HisF
MRRIRVIPVLLLKGSGLYKTIKFDKPNYIGDPINAVKIFNEKEVDEIAILDINASASGKEPNFSLIKDICEEAFMPLAYGGGITTLDHVHKLINSGVEKVILNSSLKNDLKLVHQIASVYGAQSVVVCIDYKKPFLGRTKPYFVSGEKSISSDLVQFAKDCENAGAGEVLLQSIERDGTFSGLDIKTIHEVSSTINIPLIACGGLNSVQEIYEGVKAGASAVAAGSLFVYRNNDIRSILINYPSYKELHEEVYSKLN